MVCNPLHFTPRQSVLNDKSCPDSRVRAFQAYDLPLINLLSEQTRAISCSLLHHFTRLHVNQRVHVCEVHYAWMEVFITIHCVCVSDTLHYTLSSLCLLTVHSELYWTLPWWWSNNVTEMLNEDRWLMGADPWPRWLDMGTVIGRLCFPSTSIMGHFAGQRH